VSALRAKCPDCRTLTAVAIGPDYQCHSCGREFAAGLVRVGIEIELPWPEAAAVPEADGPEAVARLAPKRPLVVGGPAWAHEGAVSALGGAGVVRPGERVPPAPFYVAVDLDDPALPAGDELERLLAEIPAPAGAGFTGAGPEDAERVTRLARALGL
jgi:hypothetical protein